MRLKVVLLLMVTWTALWAAPLATVVKTKGKVQVFNAKSVTKSDLVSGAGLEQGDLVVVFKGAHAVLKWPSGTTIALDENSRMLIEQSKQVALEEGECYYKTNPLKTAAASVSAALPQALSVRTRTATIGIRGTEFIADSQEEGEAIYLREGRIDVTAGKGEFALYKRVAQEGVEAEKKAFEAYKNETDRAFNGYKKQLEAEFVAYVKSVNLEPMRALTISGNRAEEGPMEAEVLERFDRYREMIGNAPK